ncbi:hypothetical protein G9U51_12930 [Calidifontibacter sp. DB0510]|uniref:Uncharacterized protein n=1 Tax=Metallococcus carri TaxID=1656884 RepID=A0A967EFJ6_9MICO|nr:hypothetical protein [Metallococcus carri]NHN56686.1 hypothetical protein [Metallococcus carri]NOP38985.1 hypothetical protein [Calidifontibacter sp. DB2511S]
MTTAASVAELQHLLRAHHEGTGLHAFPVHPVLRAAFPQGLRSGMTYAVDGSLTVGLGLIAGASADGSWCAAMGLPDLGVEAAAAWDIDLERLVLVPQVPAERWVDIVCTLIEAVDLVLSAPPPVLSPGTEQRLLARLRTRRAVLVTVGAWSRAQVRIEAHTLGWEGLAQGHGLLERQRIRLAVRRGHRQSTHTFTWPAE